jgi:glutamate/tyrosine decarboxylase-like PLP-dependent enzyme
MPRPQLSPEEFRKLAARVTEFNAELLESLSTRPAFPTQTSGAETERLFHEPLPEQGIGEGAIDDLREVIAYSRPPGPRFFAYVLGSGEPVAALGDYLASVLNQNVTAWRSAPAAVAVERTVVSWLAQAIGCAGFEGSLVGGGSSANLMALAMAREAKLPANEQGARPGTVYVSSEVHMSIPKTVALLGLGRQNVRVIPVDSDFRMDVRALETVLKDDRAAGRTPVAVVASAGTVSTGAIDPLAEIADIAHAHGAWFHVDGAYGALAAIAVPERFKGLSKADSLSLDPHKWLYMPMDCGCLLFKDPGWAHVAFSHTGEYARALSDDLVEGFAFFEQSLELSRRFRALKVWLSLRYHGMSAFREAIILDLALAQRLKARIEQEKLLELLAPVPLSAVCFRYLVPGKTEKELNKFNADILRKVIHERGRVYISNASIHGKFALRACIVNHRATAADVDLIVDEVLAAAGSV